MRYLRVVEEQGRYVASLPEMAQPTPARGEVLIRVTASGVNRADLSQIAGRYPPPPGESEILGLEVSGTLVETGEPVCALLAGGGDAEYVAAPAGQVFPAPAGLDLVSAAGIPEARSEEHTSELQSRVDLVCRLLLEKKKKKQEIYRVHIIAEY